MRIILNILVVVLSAVCAAAEPSASAISTEAVVAQLTKKYEVRLEAQEARIAALEARVAALEMPVSRVAIPSIARSTIESRITSDFDGLEMDKVFSLANGQKWRQTEPYIWIYIAVMPAVTIYQSDSGVMKMQVEGIGRAVAVERLK